MEHCAPQRLVTGPSAPYQWVQSKPHCKGGTRRPPASGCRGTTTAVGAPTCCRRGQPRATPIPQHSGSQQALQDTLWPRGIPFPTCPVCSPHTSLPYLVALAQPLAPFLITKHPSPPLLLEAVQGEGGAARGAPGLGPPGPRTPSQKHRMVEVRRDLWRPSSPTPLLKHGHREHVVQGHIQAGFEYLHRRLHSFSVNLLCHQHSKEFFPHTQMELCVSVCASWFSSCHWEPLNKSLALSS